jgi:hypothetical protein
LKKVEFQEGIFRRVLRYILFIQLLIDTQRDRGSILIAAWPAEFAREFQEGVSRQHVSKVEDEARNLHRPSRLSGRVDSLGEEVLNVLHSKFI